jgi:hypothetical protein
MFGNSVPYQNPAESTTEVPPQFLGHEEAWSILSAQLGLDEFELAFMSSEDMGALMMLVDQLEQNLITQDVFVASARDLLPEAQIGGGGDGSGGSAGAVPAVLQNIPDGDDAWAAISENLQMSKEAFEAAFDDSYAVLLRVAATEYLTEQISEAQFIAQVSSLLGLGGDATPYDDSCPAEFEQAGVEYAWDLLVSDGWSRSMWDQYPVDMRDRILQKAFVLFGGNQAVTEYSNQEFLEFAYLQREAAERQLMASQTFDPTTVPAPSAQYSKAQEQVETSLRIVFGSAGLGDASRHDIAYAMTIYADAIETNTKVPFTHEMILKSLDYFFMLGFPDYRPVELATIMAMVNAGQLAVLDAERRAMALDNNRSDALCQSINKQIVLAAFGPKARAQLDSFCAQAPAKRASDLDTFYENDLALILGVTRPQLMLFVLENFDARVTGQLADLGSQLEAGAPAPTAEQVRASTPGLDEVRRGIPATRASQSEQKSIIRRPTAPQRGANTTSGARLAEANLPAVDKVKLGAIFVSALAGIGYLTYSIHKSDDRYRS